MHVSNVFAASIDSELGLAATGSVSGEVVLWSLPSFQPKRELVQPGNRSRISLVDLAFDAGKKRLVVMPDWAGPVEVWALDTVQQTHSWAPFNGRNYSVATDPGSGLIMTLGADLALEQPKPENAIDDPAPVMAATVVRIWNGKNLVRELAVGPARGRSITFDAKSKRLAATAGNRAVVWQLVNGKVLRRVEHTGEIARVDLIGDALCCVGTTGSACYDDKTSTETPGAAATAAVGLTTASWVISATYEAVEIRRRGHGTVVDRIPGRAYDITESGGTIWAVFTDRLVEIREGHVTGVRHMLRAPRQ